jgi:hypothetical protein
MQVKRLCDDAQMGSGRRVRQIVFLSMATWTVCLGVWLALLDVEHSWGCNGFQTSDSNVDGTQQWQWFPPGMSCTYHVAGQTHTDSPPTARIGILALLVLWPTSTIALGRAAAAELKARDASAR